ncbi:hypothetical protein DFH29DRAFT_1076883 [Suillus ampliporus]|nr:hypothetical protein DFH29DRAFT_1076883 [Suillus ampliporus]
MSRALVLSSCLNNSMKYSTYRKHPRATPSQPTYLPRARTWLRSLISNDNPPQPLDNLRNISVYNYTDFESTWDFSPAPVACATDSQPSDAIQFQVHQLVKRYQERPNGATEAQKVIQDYLQRHDTFADTRRPNTTKKLPMIPYNRDSIYILITDDGRSTIDLEKHPEPAIRLFHHDLEGVAQAISTTI